VSTVTLPATYKGGDLESLFALTREDSLTLSIAYLDAAFTRLDPATAPSFGGTGLASASRWQAAADLRHTFSLPHGSGLTADVRTAYRTSSYVAFPLDPRLKQPGYALTDFTLTFTPGNPHYSVTAYVRNLTNEYYKVGGTMTLGVVTSNDLLQIGIPRTLGVLLNMSF
jgi:iron complex outermembrane receptor protein